MQDFEAILSTGITDVGLTLKYKETIDGDILFTNDGKANTKFYLYEIILQNGDSTATSHLLNLSKLQLKNQYETLIICSNRYLLNTKYIAFDIPIEDINSVSYKCYIVRAIIEEDSTLLEAIENNMLNFYLTDIIYYILYNDKLYLIETEGYG